MSEVIRRRRQELRMSQAELAKQAGTDARQIRRYEAGEVQPSFPQAKAIAEALEISLDELAGGLPLQGMVGPWWLAMKEPGGSNPISARIEVVQAAGEYQAFQDGVDEESGLPPKWRMSLRRERDRGLLCSFTDIGTIGVAVLAPMSPGWAGRWISLDMPANQGSGLIALSRVPEDLPYLLDAALPQTHS